MSSKGFEVQVSPDRMTVTVRVEADAVAVTSESVIAALRELKLKAFDDGIVMEALQRQPIPSAKSFVVARGESPTTPKSARVEYRVPVADGVACTVAKVEAGQVVAEFAPGTPGVGGFDVFGTLVPFPKDPGVQIGRNLTHAKDGLTADVRGNLRLHDQVLSVEPLLEISEDESNFRPVTFDGDATVKGSFREGHTLTLTGSLTVTGALEAVHLNAAGAVHVRGGLIGKAMGRYHIGGDLRCRFIRGGAIYVGGDVHVQNEINCSRLICAGRIEALLGPVGGGDIVANGGLVCKVVGQASGTPTLIEVGAGKTMLSTCAATAVQIDANRKRVADVRAKIEPLMRNMRQLTAAQKERATELLYEAGELEEATKKMMNDLQQKTRTLREKARAEVQVTDVAHAGVTFRLGNLETLLTTSFKGPFTITLHKRGLTTEIVLVEPTSRSVMALPTRPVAGLPVARAA